MADDARNERASGNGELSRETVHLVDPRVLIVDEDIAGIQRPLSDKERKLLEEAISQEGVLSPVLVWPRETPGGTELVVVDGHARVEIAARLGMRVPIVKEAYEVGAEAKIGAILAQLGRRNLKPIARMRLAAKLKPLWAEAAAERSRRGKKLSPNPDPRPISDGGLSLEMEPPPGRVDEKLAEVADVGRNKMRQCIELTEEGREDLLDDAESGVISSINHAYEINRALSALPTAVASAVSTLDFSRFATSKSIPELRELDKMGEGDALACLGMMSGAEELPPGARKPASVDKAHSIIRAHRRSEDRRLAHLRRGEEANVMLPEDRLLGWHHDEWQNRVGDLPDGVARALICDPPFGIDHEGGHGLVHHGKIKNDKSPRDAAVDISNMLRAFDRILLPDAHILVFCDAELESLMRGVILSCGYRWRASIAWSKGSPGMRSPSTAFEQDQERIIHVVKGKALPGSQKAMTTLMHPRVVEKEKAHRHQKPVSLALELIQATTAPGELILDPFGGVATVPFAALSNGRRAWGTEFEKEFHEVGEARLRDARRGRIAYLDAMERERSKSAAEKEGNDDPGVWTPTRPKLRYRTGELSTVYPPDESYVLTPEDKIASENFRDAVSGALQNLGELGGQMAERNQAAQDDKLLLKLDDDLNARLRSFALSQRRTVDDVVESLIKETVDPSDPPTGTDDNNA